MGAKVYRTTTVRVEGELDKKAVDVIATVSGVIIRQGGKGGQVITMQLAETEMLKYLVSKAVDEAAKAPLEEEVE